MIITPSYRKFHAELVDLNNFVITNLENPAEDFAFALVRATNALSSLVETDEQITVMEDDMEMLLCLMSLLLTNNDYDEPASTLWRLSNRCSTDTVFEQQVAGFQKDVVFTLNYGFDGTKVFGEDIMGAHLRGLEAVHETEMTSKALRGLESSLSAFDTFLSWYPEIRENPFDAGNIIDDYIRLSRMVRGA